MSYWKFVTKLITKQNKLEAVATTPSQTVVYSTSYKRASIIITDEDWDIRG